MQGVPQILWKRGWDGCILANKLCKPSVSRFFWPQPAPPPRCAPPAPSRCGVFVFLVSKNHIISHLSIVKPGHAPRACQVGQCTAGRLAMAGPAGWNADGFLVEGHNCALCPPGHRSPFSWTFFRRHENRKRYVNRRRNETRGWRAVYPRFINRTKGAFCSWLLNSGPTLFDCVKPFSCNAGPGIIPQSYCK